MKPRGHYTKTREQLEELARTFGFHSPDLALKRLFLLKGSKVSLVARELGRSRSWTRKRLRLAGAVLPGRPGRPSEDLLWDIESGALKALPSLKGGDSCA